MNTKKLKQLVLDLAIHGKLVPQDPNDEPASELLKRIQEEKAKTAKGKKTFISSDNLDEVPFEVPSGWVWCRLGDIATLITKGASPSWQGVKYEDKGILFITSENVGSEKLLLEKKKYLNPKFNEIQPRSILKRGDILTNIVGASIGRTTIFDLDEDNANINQAVALIRLVDIEIGIYVLKCFCSLFVINQLFDQVVETARANVSLENISNILIPLPPLSEQNRIVSAIEKWFTVINQIESNEADLRKSIEQTQKKVLDLAIHGKLVEQDENDEPASELLKRIKEEKAKTAKGKKAIADVEIDEVPFELPKGWVWCRLGHYLDVRDGTHESPKYVDFKEGVPFVTSKNLKDGKIDFSSVQHISFEDHRLFSQRSFVENNDILFAMIGSIGNPVLVRKDRDFSIKNVALFKHNDIDLYNMSYVFYFLQYIQFDLRKGAKGGMQPFIPLSYFRNDLYIPLPPLAEQKRIVAKVEEVMGELDKMVEMMG